MKDLRSLVVKLVIGSFSLAALLGIAALLGGSFGVTELRVLLTTTIVGTESVAVLCYLAVAGRPTAWVGRIGGVLSLLPFGIALWLTWSEFGTASTAVWDTFGITVTLAASLAQVCLILPLAGRDQHAARRTPVLLATLVAIALVAAMIIMAIVDGSWLEASYWRVFGILTILDVLGTVVLAALGAFGRRADPVVPRLQLTADAETRLRAEADQRGTTPQQLLDEAIDRYLSPGA